LGPTAVTSTAKQADLDPKLMPWERQPLESERAYAAFVTYRDQGDERSVRQVARTRELHETQCQRWSGRWRWSERVMAWDRHLGAVATKEKEKAVREMTVRHASLANAGLGVLQEPIKELIRRISSGELDLSKIPVGDLLRLVRQSAQAIKDLIGVERVARGVPETVVGGVFGVGASPATVAAMVQALFDDAPMLDVGDQSDALRQLLEKPPAQPAAQTPA
jgi:hypothetical protein